MVQTTQQRKPTRKQAYLDALRGQQNDRLVWAPNFDWWYSINTNRGTVPDPYRGLSCNGIIRAVRATIWRRVGVLQTHVDGVTTTTHQEDGVRTTVTHTPVGDLQTKRVQASDFSNAWFLKEHAVKTLDDLAPLSYLIEATHYEPNYAPAIDTLREVGDDGVVLTCLPPVPYIQFAKTDVGYENAFYLMQDYPERVERIFKLYQDKFLEAYRVAAASPLELISNGDNMDCWTCPPKMFERHAIPYYHGVREIVHAAGKICQGHWCGRAEDLLHLVPDCGLDVIEAITPKPMTELDIEEALDICQGKVVIQGGLPSVLMCHEGGTRDRLRAYLEDLLERVGHRPGFILGMGDNVPANADFHRVAMVSRMVNEYNRTRRPAKVGAAA